MREEFKKTTPWVFTGRGTVIRYKYGFTCFQGNAGPYFSITGEEWRARRGSKEPLPAGHDCECCGCIHELIPLELAYLNPAVPFHLFDPTHGPMHYIANGLYRLEQAAGEHDDDIHRPRPGDPDPLECFKSHVCYGVLPEDNEHTIRNVLLCGIETRTLWLNNRLPRLREKFDEVVVKGLGLEELLRNAMAQYTETSQVEP